MITRTKNQAWRTPRPVFEALHRRYAFTIDAAASISNHLLPRYWTRAHNALSKSLKGERAFCNPPFGALPEFLAWGREATQHGGFVYFILPGNLETAWFHELALGAEKELYRRRIAYVPPPNVDVSAPSFFSIGAMFGDGVVPSGLGFARARDGVTGEVLFDPAITPLSVA